ncbi:hypothetical protein E4U57_003554 [Claviceps arundinis]|uniref:HTH APSES-type domain-containing protein n=1 Tax=Claviceps arundinis TaxID=1623583 RepID=A0A9P7SL29_9HYPO|nr:hypothetical protein E4U57_003554 [Claviceps arundinis]KAG5960207.1 hypothetical protein E4U56_004493 [Claviceps arundinis]
MYYSQHIAGGQAPAQQTTNMSYSPHQHQQQHPHQHPHQHQQHQPSQLMHHAPATYSSNPYGHYHYGTGLASPQTAQPVPSQMTGPSPTVLPLPGVPAGQPPMPGQYNGYDTTGQHPPPGMKPRVTATLWEDEGSLCFQVEARGICVARREDNHMINGTKLLNVAGMTRGRRDGILKSEKVRHVVKIGPMHLKGVWIPFERALDFANKEKITDLLYPLFVHHIGALLCHPTNQTRTSQVMAAAERRKQEQAQLRHGHGLPSIHHQSHHPMALPASQSLSSHNMGPRPTLDRAHTFSAPPTGAPGVMSSIGSSDTFTWQGQGMSGTSTTPLTVDHGLTNASSMPSTPAATTPPGTQTVQSIPSYSQASQAYDSTRQLYSSDSTAQHSPYQPSNHASSDRIYSQPSAYAKSDMGPPSSRPSASGPSVVEQHETKTATNGVLPSEQTASQSQEEEGDHEQEAEYTHNSTSYDGSRSSYSYSAPGVGSMANESNINANMTASPGSHAPASGRATPRTAAPHQSYYPSSSGYSTPPRVQQATSNLYNSVSSDRGSVSSGTGADVYAPAADISNVSNGYQPQSSLANGSTGSSTLKRGRDDDDDDDLSPSSHDGNVGAKRRKTGLESSVPVPSYDVLSRPASSLSAPRRR